MLLRKRVPGLTLDVLQIAEDPKYVGRLTNLAISGYFSAVLSFLQKSTDPASCFNASRSSTFATCWIQASCESSVRGLLTRSIIAAML